MLYVHIQRENFPDTIPLHDMKCIHALVHVHSLTLLVFKSCFSHVSSVEECVEEDVFSSTIFIHQCTMHDFSAIFKFPAVDIMLMCTFSFNLQSVCTGMAVHAKIIFQETSHMLYG